MLAEGLEKRESSCTAGRELNYTVTRENFREQSIKKVEKCLQTRCSAKSPVCSRGKRTLLAHKDVSLIPQKEQTLGQNGF